MLDSLPPAPRAALLRQLEPVSLPVNTPMYEPEETPRHVHFLTSGMTSIITAMGTGELAEVGIVTREGFPEALHLLGPGPCAHAGIHADWGDRSADELQGL